MSSGSNPHSPRLHANKTSGRLPDFDALDLPAVRDLVRFGVMADDQFARRYAVPEFGLSRLPHLTEEGIVDLWSESLEGARIYSPTRRARLVAGMRDIPQHTTRVSHLSHDVGVVDLADYLVTHEAGARWISEFEVRDFLNDIAPAARRLPGDSRHRPDGLLVTPEARIGIELEHSDKYDQRYTDISAWFIREWRIDRVRWYIDRPRILERLRRVNQQHGFDYEMGIELAPFPPGVRMRQPPGRYAR
jgi:hypothetical protein